MIVKEISAKSILSRSKVFDYVVNPYIGCQHGCSYCYARFMKRFTGHQEPWGQFVDAKVNAPSLLRAEINRKKRGRIWISGVCDPYQPLEARYRLTRQCLQIAIERGWPITIQTRSSLVLRDLDLLKEACDIEVAISVTTSDESVRRVFEPRAPSLVTRIETLEKLHDAGIRTFAMIAPLLPHARGLADMLQDKVDYLLIDRMNYNYGDWVYRKYKMEDQRSDDYFARVSEAICSVFTRQGVDCRILF